MNTPKRVLFAGLFHETNTFVETPTALVDFTAVQGEALLALAGDSSPMGGALEKAGAFGWNIIPSIDLRAMPSGTVTDGTIEYFWSALESSLVAAQSASGGVDAVFLVLHGAMVTDTFRDVEGELLSRLRSQARMEGVPVFGVFDLHANFTERMALHADCLVAYRQNPHSDAREAARRAVDLLQRCLTTGQVPRTHWSHPPILWPPTGTGSATEPMRSLLARARAMEAGQPDFWCVNVVPGFSFADTAEAGVSFTVCTTGDEAAAKAALAELAGLAWETRAQGNCTEAPALEVVRAALAVPVSGLTVIAEPADNIGGGAPGDGTGLLRAFLELDAPNAAVAIADAEAVRAVYDWAGSRGDDLPNLSARGRLSISVGGRKSRLDAGPVALEVEVLSLSDGRFELADKNSHLASVAGDFFEMGECAVVLAGGLTLLLTTRPTPPMDVAQWTSQGLDPAGFSYLGVKAAVAHRGAYEPIAARLLWADTPGPCTSRLDTLNYNHLKRPVYPLDPLDPGFTV
jgi:microcystin degradation protein MlrC